MCAACGDTGYTEASETAVSTVAIRKWAGNLPRVLVPCQCNPIRKFGRWKEDFIVVDNAPILTETDIAALCGGRKAIARARRR